MNQRKAKPSHRLDVITLGRSSVDLYGQQIGGRLEEMRTFAKYVGGCPANIAIGSSRLGLRCGVITRVGNDHMGRYIREQLIVEGVDVTGVVVDPDRLTALVILGIRDRDNFPLIFYRNDCADMALNAKDIDAEFIRSTRSILLTGTHLSTESTYAASRRAIEQALNCETKIILDVDYRPVLWGLTSPELGENRYVADDNVTARLQSVIEHCDLIVGTEEELHILGGEADTIEALRAIRRLSRAQIVFKRGPLGCTVFDAEIPDCVNGGIGGIGFEIEVFNILGAGDAFLSGFLRGWLRNRPLTECCRLGNACGAIVVSSHGCAPASPSWEELRYFLHKGSPYKALRKDKDLERMHWAIIGMGSRLQDFTTASRTLFAHPDRTLVQVNANRHDAHKHGAIAFIGDARSMLEDLSATLTDYPTPQRWRHVNEARASEWRAVVDAALSRAPGAELTYADVLGVIDRNLGDDAIVVSAAGSLPGELHKLWRTRTRGGYHVEYGYSCMGYELAGGLGVKMAHPDREVVVVVGDGSYLMMNSEIATAVMLGCKLTVVIFDNRRFACIDNLQRSTGSEGFNNLFEDSVQQVAPSIDFAAHAQSMGAGSTTVASMDELESALRSAAQRAATSAIVVPVGRGGSDHLGGAWWDVAVPEVSASQNVRRARAVYDRQRQKQRLDG